MDRSVSLFGGSYGQTPNILGEIAMQIALSFLMPIISAAVAALRADWLYVGEVVQDRLHSAQRRPAARGLERGVLTMVERFGMGNQAAMLQGAADYVERWHRA